MRQKKAEAERAAIASEKVRADQALQETYKAEKIAETALAGRERATKIANEVGNAEIERQKIQIAAGSVGISFASMCSLDCRRQSCLLGVRWRSCCGLDSIL